jgi:bacillithiol biosynthesis cysteine-adding enzyme BshC
VNAVDLHQILNLKPLVYAYATKDERISPFISDWPSIEAFASALTQHRFKGNRKVLVEVLKRQNQNRPLSHKTSINIERLCEEKTFTVTTGHQPCLFGGPLYVILKILQTIKLAETLCSQFPGHHFVPVYWMGAEDHDLEEMNHFYAFGEKFVWETNQKGAVGEMKVDKIDQIFTLLEQRMEDLPYGSSLMKLYRKAVEGKKKYAEVMRDFINALFASYGLVTIDGNDAALKKEFGRILEDEILDKRSFGILQRTIENQKEWGKPQVNPRPINLFYLNAGYRERIVEEGSGYATSDQKYFWNKEQIVAIVKNQPECLSPNVVLRPLFQETVLPNLACIGGSGEIGYWLQLKDLFDASSINFPLLILRNSFAIFSEKDLEKLQKLRLSWSDIFLQENDLVSKVVQTHNGKFSIDRPHQVIVNAMENARDEAVEIDATLDQVYMGEIRRIEKRLFALQKRTFRAQKRMESDRIEQALRLKSRLFPDGVFLERRINFAHYYAMYGPEFLNWIYERIDPIKPYMHALVLPIT